MNTKKNLTLLAIIGILFLSGCMTSPYYGGSGYYQSSAYGYGYQAPLYINSGYIRGNTHFIGGYRHMDGRHKHSIGGHRHMNGGHNIRGHHRGGGHHQRGSHRGGHHR